MSDIHDAARALGSKGGKATAAQYAGHHEAWGSKGGKKAARTLGKAGRAERARKGHETRRRNAERCPIADGCVFNPGHSGRCHIADPSNPNWIIKTREQPEPMALAPASCFCNGSIEPVDGFEVNHSANSCGWIREGEPGTKAFLDRISSPEPKGSKFRAMAAKCGPLPESMLAAPLKEMNAKERLAAGLCRRCPTTRYVDPKTGKTNKLWCKTHRAIQLKQDKRCVHDE